MVIEHLKTNLLEVIKESSIMVAFGLTITMKPHTTLALVAIAAASLTGCQLKENSMNYFQNESEVMIIKGENDDLNIENRLDRVSLYGSVDITRDQAGLEQALRLKGVVDGMVSALNAEQLNGVLPNKVVPVMGIMTDNPL